MKYVNNMVDFHKTVHTVIPTPYHYTNGNIINTNEIFHIPGFIETGFRIIKLDNFVLQVKSSEGLWCKASIPFSYITERGAEFVFMPSVHKSRLSSDIYADTYVTAAREYIHTGSTSAMCGKDRDFGSYVLYQRLKDLGYEEGMMLQVPKQYTRLKTTPHRTVLLYNNRAYTNNEYNIRKNNVFTNYCNILAPIQDPDGIVILATDCDRDTKIS